MKKAKKIMKSIAPVDNKPKLSTKLNLIYCEAVAKDVFSIDGKNWITCRETFASSFTHQDEMYYRISGNYYGLTDKEGLANVKRFINETEKKLKWKLTEFYETNYESIYLLKLRSDKWLNGGRALRSLFTLLLRAGIKYKEGMKYSEVLDRNSYSKSTKQAIVRLLNGYTIVDKSSKNMMWVEGFSGTESAKSRLNPNEALVASQAHKEWLEAGQPDGLDEDLWKKAKEKLKKQDVKGIK